MTETATLDPESGIRRPSWLTPRLALWTVFLACCLGLGWYEELRKENLPEAQRAWSRESKELLSAGRVVCDRVNRDFPYGLSLKTNQARNVAHSNKLRPPVSNGWGFFNIFWVAARRLGCRLPGDGSVQVVFQRQALDTRRPSPLGTAFSTT